MKYMVWVLMIATLQPSLTNATDGTGQSFATRVVTEGLVDPVSIVFIAPDAALVAQRPKGVITRVDLNGGETVNLEGLPEIYLSQYVGIHNLALHPDYQSNQFIYVSYAEGEAHRSTSVVDRFRLAGKKLRDRTRIFTADQYSEGDAHYAARLAFDGRYLFIALGDRRHRERAQHRGDHVGTIVRLFDDGTIPPDNPFLDEKDVLPEIWSYGHRNPQGLTVDQVTGELWSTEHGPRGGDELNQILAGKNYGWPEISFGFEYDGGPIGKGITLKEGMEQPRWVWVPSIAPSGLIRYRGSQFPAWDGDFFTGSLAFAHLNRISMEKDVVVLEQRLLTGQKGRIRAVAQAPDGSIYIGSDSGELIQLYAP